MNEFLQLLVTGLATGAIYAGLALALSVIHAGSGILNFAQGQQAAIAAFTVLTLTTHGWSLWLALPAVVAGSALLGAALERVLVRPVESGEPLALFTVTAALLLGLGGLTSIIWDHDQHALASPFGGGVVGLGPVTVTAQQLGSCLVAAAVMTATALFLRLTPLGLKMRAVASNPASAVLLGIRPGRMLAIGWALAAAVGAVAGVMAAPVLSVSTDMMTSPLLLAFAAAALGGFGSQTGAVVGGLVIGVTTALAGRYVPGLGGDLAVAVPFAVIWMVLLVRPAGLFGQAAVVRA